MPELPAIRLQKVSKIYRLYGSQRDQLIDVLGLGRLGIRAGKPSKEFAALTDISIDVPRGHRIGIVGRNGAGKTTLLKLICGNFAPTSGEVEIRGTVQALLGMGLGFHPDYTGRENVVASLQYNGLTATEHRAAISDIIDFCELGEFIDQPFKTYSLGMQARLMFAVATAVKPDILIIDEVLGAGDAYFVAKSRMRVDSIVKSGCTMLLVSHSMQQVLGLCNEAIWLDEGRIRMRGDAFIVVKAYEEFMYGRIRPGRPEELPDGSKPAVDTAHPEPVRRDLVRDRAHLQVPGFQPHAEEISIVDPVPFDECEFHYVARGGISRWDADEGVKLRGFYALVDGKVTDTLVALRPAQIVFKIQAELSGRLRCRYGLAMHDHLGRCVVRVWSPVDEFVCGIGEIRRVVISLNPCQLGAGEYTAGITIIDDSPIEQVNQAKRYDQVPRSFVLRVAVPDTLLPLAGEFFHSAEWFFLSHTPER